MLRDMLRLHPDFACPEETHIFRWSDPYGTPLYNNGLLNNPVLKRHREIDGIAQEEFATFLKNQTCRAHLWMRYMDVYVQRKKPGATTWFDKSPQNVYGAPQIAASMPRSKFIHIVRDPVQVVSSLRIGKVMKVENLVGACNYWNEAVNIMYVMKCAFPMRVLEFRYEDFVREPVDGLKNVFDFLKKPFDPKVFTSIKTRHVVHDDENVLSPEEIEKVHRLCQAGRKRYGYATADVPQAGDATQPVTTGSQ